MYGIAHIWEEMDFWTEKTKNIWRSKKTDDFDKKNALAEYQIKLSEIELKIRNDIEEYYAREEKLGIFFYKRRKREIICKIAELEVCLGELKRRQDEFKTYQL